MIDKGVYRIVDANLNRLMEALRVCEDIVRFASNDKGLTLRLKHLRHDVFRAIKDLREEHLQEIVASRNLNDVGLQSIESESDKDDLVDLFLANAQRGKESLRVLEEVMKLFEENLFQKFKDFRFVLYEIEKESISYLEDIRNS